MGGEGTIHPLDRVAPTPDEVMGLALAIKANDVIWQIFQRMGRYGLPTRDERSILEGFQDVYLNAHNLSEKNPGGWNVVLALLRRVATGQINSLDSPEAMALLQADYPRNVIKRMGDHGVAGGPPRIKEIMWMANALLQDDGYLEVINRIVPPEVSIYGLTDKDRSRRTEMQYSYLTKHGLLNRTIITGIASSVLYEVIDGRIARLDSQAAWDFVKTDYPRISRLFE